MKGSMTKKGGRGGKVLFVEGRKENKLLRWVRETRQQLGGTGTKRGTGNCC